MTLTHLTLILRCPICIDFREGGKPEYPEKNPRSTGESTARNLSHGTSRTRLGFSGKKHNASQLLKLLSTLFLAAV